MAGPGQIAKTRALGTQVGREVTVVADLIEQGQHGGIQRALSHRMLVELAHRGEHVIDPPGAARPALPGTGALNRRGLEHRHEQRQCPGRGQKIPPAVLAPRQVTRQVTGIDTGGALGPVGAKPQMTQEGVSDRDSPPVVADDSPVGERVGQRDTLRPHDGRLRGSQLRTWRTVSRGCDNDPAQVGSG